MNDLTYYQRSRYVILNRAEDYYQNDRVRLKDQAKNKYRHLSEEQKNKNREYGKNRYHNMPEEEKQRLKEYQKNYGEAKSLITIINGILFLIVLLIVYAVV